MKKLLILLTVFAVFADCTAIYGYCTPANPMPTVSAKYAAVVEIKSGSLICGKGENERASMASTTKIMTALLLCELADLDAEITVTEEMVTVEGSSMGLRAGDKVHFIDLLYGMLLASGNDAANATAIAIAGSVENFAILMNKRAEQIGMSNTHFVTPSGLDDSEHYSTAYDMALLACEALCNEDFSAACSSASKRLEYGNPPYSRTLTNHNKLLKMYDGCIGVKTGFTKKSGRCLVSAAEKDGKGVVAVTLNAPDDWNDHIAMLDYGLSQLETRQLVTPELRTDIPVVGGDKEYVECCFSTPTASLKSEDFYKVSTKITVNDILFAPLNEGECVGRVEWTINGRTVASSDIVLLSSTDSADTNQIRGFTYWIKRLLCA